MAISVVIPSVFEHLNGDRSMARLQNPASRERECVVDINYDGTHTYTRGGDTVDFSVIRNFTQVYMVIFTTSTNGDLHTFVPASDNSAATGKIRVYGAPSGGGQLAELSAASTGLRNKTIRAIIRGI